MGQKIPGNTIRNIQLLPDSITAALNDPTSSLIVSAPLVFGLIALFCQLYWKKMSKNLGWIPAALPATIIASLLAINYDMPRVVLAPIVPHVTATFETLTASLTLDQWSPIFWAAIGLAVVASAESLLTARAIDVLVKTKHGHTKTDLEKELKAQGAGNLLSGLLGGMPLTGVMVRSAANFDSGAQTRNATIFHGILVALSVFVFPFVMEKIPLAVLASILVLTGWKLLNVSSMIAALKYRIRDTYLWPLTAAAILSTDLLKGFCFGIVVWLIDDLIIRKGQNSKASSVN
jgi:MFS superfamily sulfate permease-like transporter